jgi:Antibiotic biosynthesis monooxygenase
LPDSITARRLADAAMPQGRRRHQKGSGGMYARSTTMRIEPSAVDDLVSVVDEEILPMVTQQQGCVGLSLLVDRDSGRCITTSAWETAEAMEGSAERVRESRERVALRFGTTAEVQHWQVAVFHRAQRAGDGASARVAWLRADPANLRRVVDAYRDSLMPWWERTPGFRSNSLLVDRGTGRCASAVAFESRDAMAHTRDQFTTLREEFTQRMGLQIEEVAEFDVALAHLRLPETV